MLVADSFDTALVTAFILSIVPLVIAIEAVIKWASKVVFPSRHVGAREKNWGS